MKLVKTIQDNIPVTRIMDDKYQYTFAYYSANKWVDKNRLVLARNGKGTFDANDFNDLVLIDLEKGTEEVLIECGEASKSDAFAYVIHNTKLYYFSNGEVRVMDIETREDRFIMKGERFGLPHITNDGKYLNFHANPETQDGLNRCVVINTETFESEVVFEKNFNKPFYTANHMMICPTDKDKVFFAHEGDTFYVSNRLWLYEKGKELRPIAKQRLDELGNLGDCFGHECWAADGKGLYFVKYPCSPTPPTGICYVDTNGNQTDVLYGKYNYWHVCAAPNGKYLASDTIGGKDSEVCFINMETGKETKLFDVKITWSHPCHPHPAFNTDSSLLCYHELYRDKITVGFVETEDIR